MNMLNVDSFRVIKPVLEFTPGTKSETAKQRVLTAITNAKSITAPDIMIAAGMLSGSVYRTLTALEVDGSIKRTAKDCTAGNPVYCRQCFCGTTCCMEVESYTPPTNLFECEPEPDQDILDAISKINYGMFI